MESKLKLGTSWFFNAIAQRTGKRKQGKTGTGLYSTSLHPMLNLPKSKITEQSKKKKYECIKKINYFKGKYFY